MTGTTHSRPSGGMMREIDQGQLLASIAATLHDCILSVDADGVILWASPATAGVLGWRPEDLAGSDFAVLFPRDGGELRLAVIERLLSGRRVEPFVDVGVRRDGSSFKVQVTLGPVHGPDGDISGAIAVLRDVTAELVEQRELALALEKSRAHFDQAATPQAIVGLDGRLESVNPAWCELFGRGEGWFADSHLLDLVHPVDESAVRARLERLADGQIDSISYRGLFRDADGLELPLLLDASLLREPDGRPYAVAAAVGDADEEPDDDARPHLAEVLRRRSWDAAVVLDEELTLIHVSGAVARMLGLEREDLLHHPAWDFVHPGDVAAVTAVVERLRAEPRRSERAIVRVRDAEDHWRSLEVTGTNCLSDPEVLGFVADLRDVTEQVRTDEALRLSEALHRAMVESTQEGILATSPEGLVIFANDTAADILGRSVDQLRGEDPVRLLGLHPESRLDPVEDETDGGDGDGGRERYEVVYRRPDGGERTLRTARRPLSSRDGRLGALVSVTDVTDARNAELVLRRRALHDPLTGLPNRYLFLDRLETAAARQQRRPGRGIAVLFLDVDHFKRVNDSLGHVAGDEVLRQLGERLLAAVRGADTVGRLGGDEFAVICEDTGAEEAAVVARRILDAVAAPTRVGDTELEVTISVGIAVSPPYPLDEVVRRADEAMYRAKQDGGGRLGIAP